MLPNRIPNLMFLIRCPNPLDPALPQTLPSDPPPSNPKSQTRRFTITTFQFLPDGEFKDPEEEVRISRFLHFINKGKEIFNNFLALIRLAGFELTFVNTQGYI